MGFSLKDLIVGHEAAGTDRPGKFLKVPALEAGEGRGQGLSPNLWGDLAWENTLEHSSWTDVDPTHLPMAAKVL